VAHDRVEYNFCISGVRRVTDNCIVRPSSCRSEVRFEDGQWIYRAQDYVPISGTWKWLFGFSFGWLAIRRPWAFTLR